MWPRQACSRIGLTRDSAEAGSCLKQPGTLRAKSLSSESNTNQCARTGRRVVVYSLAGTRYSARSASTALTFAARAAGTAEAITAAARIVNADATNASVPG